MEFAIQTSDGGYALTTSTFSNDGDVSGNHGNSKYLADIWVVKLKPSSDGVKDPGQGLKQTVQIFPNPARDQVHLELSPSQIIYQMEIYDMLGRKYPAVSKLNGNTATLDVLTLVPASYIARVTYSYNGVAGIYILPFIISH